MAESALDYEKGPVRYNAIDGVDEMFIGLLSLALMLCMHFKNLAPEGSIWHSKYTFTFTSALILVAVFIARTLLKERITYRRTGYVMFRYSKVKFAIGGIVGFAGGGAAVLCVSILSRPPQQDRYLIFLAGLLWAFLYIYFGIYTTRMYYAWRYLVALLIAAGPFAVYSALPNVRDISTLSTAVFGGCFLISGVITFWSYLRNTRAVEAQSENNPQ